MLTQIDSKHPIFASPSYLMDVVPFNLIEFTKDSAKLILSDEQSWLICSMLHPSVPTWVWTADIINERQLNELSAAFCEIFRDSDSQVFFVAKPYTADALAKRYLEQNKAAMHRVKMQSYECPKVIAPRNKSVIIEHPTSGDLDTIALFYRNFRYECTGEEKAVREMLPDAEKFIQNEKAFVTRVNGTAVAMAQGWRSTINHIAINQVYTYPQYRSQGLASALVAHISGLVIESGKIPMLYTDLSNPASNKAYQNVGFVPRGRVDEVKLIWGN